MKKLKNIFTDAASDVADQFYPKGDERRGEFIRDAAVLYTKLEADLIAYKSTWKKRPIAMQAVTLTDIICHHFETVKEGMYSDLAYNELLTYVEAWLNGDMRKKDLVDYVEFTFGFNGLKEFNTVYQVYQKEYAKMIKVLTGEETKDVSGTE